MVQIITDTTCDYTLDEIKEKKLEVCPLNVLFGDSEAHVETYEWSIEEQYRRMAECDVLPSTQAVNPYQFEKAMRHALEEYDEVVGIMLGSKMSATCQSAVIAANTIGSDKITVLDSTTIGAPLKFLVDTAVSMRDLGCNATDIVATIENLIPRAKYFIALENLNYAKHGGRISEEEFVAGENLGIRPILEVNKTFHIHQDKVKGKKGIFRYLTDKLSEFNTTEEYPIYISHGNTPELAEDFKSYLERNGIKNEIHISCTCPVFSSHTGPGSLGIAFIAD